MTQKNIIITALALLVIVLGGWYLLSPNESGEKTAQEDSSSNGADSKSDTTTAKPSTLRAVAERGGNYTCSITTVGGEGRTTGTIFASGDKMRLDFRAETNSGGFATIHTVRDGVWAYTWLEGQKTGTKVAVTSSSSILPQPSGGVIIVNDDTEITSECRPWIPKEVEFELPAGVVFSAS